MNNQSDLPKTGDAITNGMTNPDGGASTRPYDELLAGSSLFKGPTVGDVLGPDFLTPPFTPPAIPPETLAGIRAGVKQLIREVMAEIAAEEKQDVR